MKKLRGWGGGGYLWDMAVPYSATCISYAEYATKFADKILEESGLDATL
jgi:hypothetical protein